jgi:hypothetical protein
MGKGTRKQKGSGGFASKPVYADVEVEYSGKGLTTDDLGELLTKYTPRERDRIAYLNISGNNLNELPAIPLQHLITLECDNNQLTLLSSSHYPDFLRSLTDLYPYLQRLFCSRNQLTSLPRLPPNIVIIECDNNQLTALPELPESLNFLICNNNQLTVLPELPVNLQEIVCHDNPFIAPFDKFVKEYINTPYISVLIDKVNRYYAEQRNNYAPMNKNKAIKSTVLNELKYMPPSNKYPGGQGYHNAYANFLEATNSRKTPNNASILTARPGSLNSQYTLKRNRKNNKSRKNNKTRN